MLGDVHWNHPNTPTTHILSGLRKAFPNSPSTGDIDWFVFEGDMFDREMVLRDDNVREIDVWVTEFLRTCRDRNICLRVLEGTPSHDWKQSKIFEHLNNVCRIGADVKYISELTIEYMERFNIHVLYIPDEWRVRCDDTWLEVLALLKQHGLEKVDYIVMHGAFHHQMPTNTHGKLELHNAERYMSICKRYIMVGHVHQWSRFKQIIGSGSWDRLSHGDESPKGYTRITVKPNMQDDEIRFVENVNAQRYDTIDCTQIKVDDLHRLVDEKVKSLPDGSFVRLKGYKTDISTAAVDLFRERYPHLFFDTKIVSGEDEQDKQLFNLDLKKNLISLRITKDNIHSLLIERLQKKFGGLNIERAKTLFREVIDGHQ